MQIREFFQEKPWRRWDKSQWTILILAGILLMVIAIPTGDAGGGAGDAGAGAGSDSGAGAEAGTGSGRDAWSGSGAGTDAGSGNGTGTGAGSGNGSGGEAGTGGYDGEEYAERLEQRLAEALSRIEGAGKVQVMITLEDSGESVVEKDDTKETSSTAETDSAGGSRNEQSADSGETTVYEEEDDRKTPFVGKEMTPKIAGILVVAEGGENTQVKQDISDAVMALFQIDVNRIKVVKMKIQEEED